MIKHYETVFILTPVLSEEQAKETAKKFKKTLTDLGAKVTHDEFWGLKKLAYPIQKKSTGFYFLVEFNTTSIDAVSTLEVAYKRDERVLRFLTIALDKHSLAYTEKRKAKAKGEVVEKPARKPKKENA